MQEKKARLFDRFLWKKMCAARGFVERKRILFYVPEEKDGGKNKRRREKNTKAQGFSTAENIVRNRCEKVAQRKKI